MSKGFVVPMLMSEGMRECGHRGRVNAQVSKGFVVPMLVSEGMRECGHRGRANA